MTYEYLVSGKPIYLSNLLDIQSTSATRSSTVNTLERPYKPPAQLRLLYFPAISLSVSQSFLFIFARLNISATRTVFLALEPVFVFVIRCHFHLSFIRFFFHCLPSKMSLNKLLFS